MVNYNRLAGKLKEDLAVFSGWYFLQVNVQFHSDVLYCFPVFHKASGV